MPEREEQRVYDLRGKRIWVAGHRGMVGSALVRRLEAERPAEILTVGREALDLTHADSVWQWLHAHRPDAIIVAAARVGGILANQLKPADFLVDNLQIASNTIEAAYACGVEKLVFLGSSCIYPRDAAQPIREDALLTGALEPTNEAYAIAKIAGIKMCESYRRQFGADFISAMPCNLYGPGDNFDLETSHVIPALMRKAHEAKQRGDHQIEMWGSGRPRREFLHVDDCADAIVHLLKNYSDGQHVNVGCGTDISIRDLLELILSVVGHEADIISDPSKPDGTPAKLMSNEKLSNLGWAPTISLRQGLEDSYAWYLEQNCVDA
jgi:GDP-L-fucose synthase